MKPKAYSYIRFSSEKQIQGHSLKRQSEAAEEYCKKHDLDLDNSSYRDLGISAFKGLNSTEGALKAFIDACDSGKIIKGSYLIVESLDRISRNKISDAFELLNSILKRGIVIVTLLDGKTYTQGSMDDLMQLMYSLMIMATAHEESAKKSERIGKAWANKRKLAIADGTPYTKKHASWLTIKNGRYEIIGDRANIVKRIFTMALSGHGKSSIARHLNDDEVPNWNKPKTNKQAMWHPSFIQKILVNKAVYGILTTPKFDNEVPDYYPTIVPQKDFLKAQEIREGNRLPTGKSINTLSNIFTRMCICGACGFPMHYVNKSIRSKPETQNQKYLVCSRANNKGGCKYVSHRYQMLEKHIIYSLRDMDYSKVFKTDTKDYQGEILEKKDKLLQVKKENANITIGLDFGLPENSLAVIKSKLVELDKQIKGLNTDISNLKDKMLLSNENNIADLEQLDLLLEDNSLEHRQKLHSILIKYINEITILPIRETIDINDPKADCNTLDDYHHSQIIISFHDTNKKRYITIMGKKQDKSSSFVFDSAIKYGAIEAINNHDTNVIIHKDRVDRWKTGSFMVGDQVIFSIQDETPVLKK